MHANCLMHFQCLISALALGAHAQTPHLWEPSWVVQQEAGSCLPWVSQHPAYTSWNRASALCHLAFLRSHTHLPPALNTETTVHMPSPGLEIWRSLTNDPWRNPHLAMTCPGTSLRCELDLSHGVDTLLPACSSPWQRGMASLHR